MTDQTTDWNDSTHRDQSLSSLSDPREITRRLLEILRAAAPHARGGVALAPTDGNDFEILLIGARAARDRSREIPILAQRFLAEACQRAGRDAMVISGEVLGRTNWRLSRCPGEHV